MLRYILFITFAFALETLAQCGVRGYDQGITAYSYTAQSSLATFSECGRKCTADSRCSSFAFGSGACLLYDVPV